MQERFARLRQLLSREPCYRVWRDLWEHLSDWPARDGQEMGLSYAAAHLDAWPDALRCWHTIAPAHAIWPLVRHVVLSCYEPEQIAPLVPLLEELDLPVSLRMDGVFAEHASKAQLEALVRYPHIHRLETDSVDILRRFQDHPSLRELSFQGEAYGEDVQAEDFAGFSRLDALELNVIGSLPLPVLLDAFPQATRVRSLSFAYGGEIGTLKDLHRFGALESLSIRSSALRDLRGVEAFPALRTLCLTSDVELTDISQLAALRGLQEVKLHRCNALPSIAALASHGQLESLDLSLCDALASLEGLEDAAQLRTLSLRGGASLESLSPLAGARSLRSLDLSNCTALFSLAGLEGCTRLQSLNADGCAALDDFAALRELTQLEELSMKGLPSLRDLSMLSAHPQLACLSLNNCRALSDVQAVCALPSLHTLDLRRCKALKLDVRQKKDMRTYRHVRAFQQSLKAACAPSAA